MTGSGLVLLIGGWTVPWVGPRTQAEALLVGAVWLAVMLGYELGLGRLWFRRPWPALRREFDPRAGGWLGLGMLVLLLTPWVIWAWRMRA